jgi:hypothetical protein
VLRLDNGGEYTLGISMISLLRQGSRGSTPFLITLSRMGLQRGRTYPLLRKSKAMIHDQNIPMILWEKESMKTFYVQNKIPHMIMNNITPEEAFTGVKLEVGHFRIFGCPVYIHVPKEKRTKLDPSGTKGTFVGYNESSKAYQIFILGQRQIEVSRDVTFEEEISFRRSRESQMEIDSEKKEETIPSSPSTIHRDIVIDLVDVPRYISIGHKSPAWDRENP